MSKTLINPYSHDPNYCPVWELGFAAGQKSMLTPLSVTGRWWQSSNKKIYFGDTDEYEGIQRAIDNNPSFCKWLTEEETREFT